MRNRRNNVWGLLASLAIVLLVLTGCRAFVPEVVIVNKAPETFIVGAPVEHGGGYYHYHVFWYGADADGSVERLVWALTDTTVQDPLTSDDEEDERFNPALDASTLEIAHWTTKTDSVFDFKIEQGTRISTDMTLHMVAIDDFGDYDRTPARLHFFSNTLGTPLIRFYRVNQDDGDTVRIAVGQTDTVGFNRPYEVTWMGSTPNVLNYDPDALARIDTVYPFDDGLFGYKWSLRGQLRGVCIPAQEDFWHPRKFDQASGDSFSYFGEVTSLAFANDNPLTTDPFNTLLESGPVNLVVNSVDVAGVEVADFSREFTFIVNRDPFTAVLDSAAHGSDPQIYPYYEYLDHPQIKYPFANGARIPDRTYVVVKSLGRDDPDDVPLDAGFGIGLEGFVAGRRSHVDGGRFGFETATSPLNTDLGLPDANGWYADTLGFIVGPRTTYTFNMTAADEHGRLDGTPAQIKFHVGYPPCVQCLEVMPRDSDVSDFPDPELVCYEEGGPAHPCLDGSVTGLSVRENPTEPTDLQFLRPAFFAIERSTRLVTLLEDVSGLEGTHYWINARVYRMSILFHGQDDPRERWDNPRDRMMAWRYQVNNECDPNNQIKDGGGSDDITRITASENDLLSITSEGLWKMAVEVAVPEELFNSSPLRFLQFLSFVCQGDLELAEAFYWGSIVQLGDGSVQAVAVDQATCADNPRTRPTAYNYFKQVRPVGTLPPGSNWRSCTLGAEVSPETRRALALPLSLGPVALESGAPEPDYDWRRDPDGSPWRNADNSPVLGVPVRQDFRIELHGSYLGVPHVVDCNTVPE
ncbi:hypothetical protein DRQ50_01385 [bacterium]|nr:MAG: hypothetical protein DRQ50_01385 [bacterium]